MWTAAVKPITPVDLTLGLQCSTFSCRMGIIEVSILAHAVAPVRVEWRALTQPCCCCLEKKEITAADASFSALANL